MNPVRWDTDQAVGLLQVGGQLGQKLVVRDANRCRQPNFLLNAGFDATGNIRGMTKQLQAGGYVEKRLIQGQTLDHGCYAAEQLEDLCPDLPVTLHSRG